MTIFFTKMGKRLRKSKWCKIYLSLSIVNMLASISILVPNLINAFKIGDELSQLLEISGAPITEIPEKHIKVVIESIAFILLEVWRFWISIDGILQMNSLTIYTSALFAIMSFGFSICMIIESRNWLTSTENSNSSLPEQLVNMYIQITLSSVGLMLLIPTLYTAYMVVKDFGWLAYKKIGGSIKLQKMYTIAQLFSLLLKIDAIFEVTFVFIVLIARNNWIGIVPIQVQKTYIYVYTAYAVILILSLPLAREALSRESTLLMGLFLLLQVSYLGFAVQYTYQVTITGNGIEDWYAYYVYLFTVYVVNIVTIVLTILVMKNFNKGLKKHVQWRSKNKLSVDTESGQDPGTYRKMLTPIDDED